MLHPFSDKAINAKLLSLCLAQALCSVATLIHDTYLPIYLQDVLGALPANPLCQQRCNYSDHAIPTQQHVQPYRDCCADGVILAVQA